MSKTGYRVKVWSQDEKKTQDTDALQKLATAKAVMPFNAKLDDIYKRKLVEFADLTPDEINAVMEQEAQQREAMMNQPQPLTAQPGQPPMGQPQPPPNQVVA